MCFILCKLSGSTQGKCFWSGMLLPNRCQFSNKNGCSTLATTNKLPVVRLNQSCDLFFNAACLHMVASLNTPLPDYQPMQTKDFKKHANIYILTFVVQDIVFQIRPNSKQSHKLYTNAVLHDTSWKNKIFSRNFTPYFLKFQNAILYTDICCLNKQACI